MIEYETFYFNDGEPVPIDDLNALGKDGWKVCLAMPFTELDDNAMIQIVLMREVAA